MAQRLLATLFLALFLAALPGARAAEMGVVLSENAGAYTDFSSSFQQFADGSGWRIRWTGSVDSLEALPRTDLVVAVGAEATRAVLQRGGGTPILATLIPRNTYERALADAAPRSRGSVSAIFLDQPISRLMAFTRHLLPDRQRVGVLTGAETRSAFPALRQAAAGAGLTLEVEEIDSGGNPVPAASHLLQRSDVLLALPDSAVYRRDNIRSILLTSYRFQRPVIGFSQSLVTSGALAGIYSTPAQIARQTMEVVKSLRSDAISLPPPQTPAYFAIGINQNVAKALGLTLPDEAALRRALAADKEAK